MDNAYDMFTKLYEDSLSIVLIPETIIMNKLRKENFYNSKHHVIGA